MVFLENSPLSEHSTMRLGGNARFLCTVTNEDEVLEAIDFADKKNMQIRVIGSGSNIVWSDKGFDGLVIVNNIKKVEFKDDIVTLGAGENWDDAVLATVNADLTGIEFLSLIPGTSGATPIQNVGAYGREIKDVLIDLRAYNLKDKKFVTITNHECEFSYRNSRFKTTDNSKFLITEIRLQLKKGNPEPPFYDSLQKYLDEKNIKEFTPKNIRKAVIAIRESKLPNPNKIANNGSFFANPIIETSQFDNLKQDYPEIVGWDHVGMKKVAAGWLVEQAGFKDFHDPETGMATWKHQSLVLINEKAKSASDLIKFRDKIINAVQEKFGITLHQEPELL